MPDSNPCVFVNYDQISNHVRENNILVSLKSNTHQAISPGSNVALRTKLGYQLTQLMTAGCCCMQHDGQIIIVALAMQHGKFKN